jgi:hypothetical protein
MRVTGEYPCPRFFCAAGHDSDSLVQSAVLTRRRSTSLTHARQHGQFLSRGGKPALARMLGLFLPAFANATSPTDHQIGVRCGNRTYRDGYGIAGAHRGASPRNALEAPATATLRHRNRSPLIKFLDSDVRHRRQLDPMPPDIPAVSHVHQTVSAALGRTEDNVMNDRQWNVSACAALALVFVIAITTAVMIADQLAHAI